MYGYRDIYIYIYEWLNTWMEEKVLNMKAIMMQRKRRENLAGDNRSRSVDADIKD